MDITYDLEKKLDRIISSSDVEEYRQAWLDDLKGIEDIMQKDSSISYFENSEIAFSVRRMAESSIRDLLYQKIISKCDSNLLSETRKRMILEYRDRLSKSNILIGEMLVICEDAMQRCLPGCYGMGKKSR